MKNLIVDLDGTIAINSNCSYENKPINKEMLKKLIEYKKMGFKIIINTSRNMNTYKGNIGKININTLPKIIEWLNKYNVPYDEIIIGKPWCGEEGFYIDDKAIRPSEFISKSYEEIKELLNTHSSNIDIVGGGINDYHNLCSLCKSGTRNRIWKSTTIVSTNRRKKII
ncbi:capsular biosynthesis protein [Campylobacter sp. RM12642]|uniref:capsular biosynthesis protein n=1 Tax=unclassified Campylobacter TaxID=2593542 RepID=UPI001E1AF0D9|nr:capsular biosynthesis protein [Campylobacter sp. RM12642]MBZ8008439.1 capsular biosynthesis protein [Campylobacter sp. RM9334]